MSDLMHARVAPDDVADLATLTAQANAALMRGDARTYVSLVRPAPDHLLMSPFGGAPTRGFDRSSERVERLGRFFEAGTTAPQELVHAYATADMVVLAIIERQHVAVGGLPPQDWALRVTLVFRRDGSEWRQVHRHADPLVAGISLEQAAAIARS